MDQFFSQSPKQSSLIELSEIEALNSIFPQTFEHMEIQDEIDENYLYCLNRKKSNESIQSNVIKNKIQENNENSLSIFDDYETFFNKFANINEIEYKPEESYDPKNLINSENEQKLVYSMEDEKIIKVENEHLCHENKKKELYFNIVKEKKEEKKSLKCTPPYIIKKKNRRRKKCKNQIDTSEKCFPFKKGKGLIFSLKQNDDTLSQKIDNSNNICTQIDNTTTSNQEYSPPNNYFEKVVCDKNNDKDYGENREDYKEEACNADISKNKETIDSINNNFMFKFKTKKYFMDSDGKKKRVKKKRKFKPDDIRKKIKSRFHKTLKNIINENLKRVGSKELFDFFPQCFIGNVSKKTNAKYLKLTYKELLSTNFVIELKKEGYYNSKVDINKYKKNIKVLDYLEKNLEISKKSGFDLIKNKKYKDILISYFNSAEFENSLFQLKTEKESPEYILEYINKSKNYVNFYSNVKIKDNEIEFSNDDDDEENEEDIKDNLI